MWPTHIYSMVEKTTLIHGSHMQGLSVSLALLSPLSQRRLRKSSIMTSVKTFIDVYPCRNPVHYTTSTSFKLWENEMIPYLHSISEPYRGLHRPRSYSLESDDFLDLTKLNTYGDRIEVLGLYYRGPRLRQRTRIGQQVAGSW